MDGTDARYCLTRPELNTLMACLAEAADRLDDREYWADPEYYYDWLWIRQRIADMYHDDGTSAATRRATGC